MRNWYWQYNRTEPWAKILTWCRQRFGAAYLPADLDDHKKRWTYISHSGIYFHHEDDYTLFLLRWS